MSSAAENSTPWYSAGLSFTCTQCGNCCGGAPGYVWVQQDEIDKIAANLNLDVETFTKQHVRRVGWRRSLLEKPDGDCEFLRRGPDGKAQCSIYEVRPVQCRTWPFWKSNLSSPRDWERASRGCPGINTGQHHALPVIQAAMQRNGNLPL